MAGAMRKMAVYLGLVEDENRYDDYADDYDQPGGGAGERRDGAGPARPVQAVREPAHADARPEARGASVATMPERRAPAAVTTIEAYRITTLHPRTYNEARTIGEHFREGTPVIMNLTEMDDTDAKRLVDFSAGLVFGLHGSIERVTNKVFLLSPANVDVTAEDKARIAEGGFFNQS
jgi:cell division inhibitor SepF